MNILYYICFTFMKKFNSFVLLPTCIRICFRFVRLFNFIWLHIFNEKKKTLIFLFIWQGWGEGWLPYISIFSVCIAFDLFCLSQVRLVNYMDHGSPPPKWYVSTYPSIPCHPRLWVTATGLDLSSLLSAVRTTLLWASWGSEQPVWLSRSHWALIPLNP